MPSAAPPVERQWVVRPLHPDGEALAHAVRLHPILAQLLLARDVTTPEAVRDFLQPAFNGLHAPEDLPNTLEVARALADAAKAGRRIVIYGDYDVDGITATAILWRVLKMAGADVRFYVPSRSDEGYGLNADALRSLHADGAEWVVTVDCGVTAVEEARLARELGLKLIITDHHEPRDELPDAEWIVHPYAVEPVSSNPHLSGAGVAFKIAWTLARELCGAARVDERFRDFLLEATALAALGLVADVVPLIGENRIIATYGLKALSQTKNHGLKALIDVTGLGKKHSFDDYDVGFGLAPRINAVGRLGHAREAVELLLTDDPTRAYEIARELDRLNRQRREVERKILERAVEMVYEREFHRDGCRAIVVASEEWHPGVVGIVASRLVDRFHRPAIVIALDDNGGKVGRGSGRSIRHFPLHEALAKCDAHLLGHGGHAMAAGVTIAPDALDAFTSAFQREAARRLTPADLVPKLTIDAVLPLEMLVAEFVRPLQRLAPFGQGNPRPVFATRDLEIVDQPRTVGGNGAHLSFNVRADNARSNEDGVHDARSGSTYRKAIAFFRGARLREMLDHRRLHLAYEPMLNTWNGRTNVELKVVDWQWAD